MIITYYSYKGGSGRTQLLANIAAYFCHYAKKKVLLIDWDLEAPGLHFFFNKPDLAQDGLIEFFNDYITYAKNEFNLTEEKLSSKFSKSFADYTQTIVENQKGRIDLMPAGNYKDDFLNKVNAFNWKEYYEKFDGGNHIEIWKKHLNSLDYDFILIDSRTGIHDYSGICNIQMPDANVVVVTPTSQSFNGSQKVIEGIITSKYVNSRRREPIILPILSRIDPNSNELKGEWIENFKNEFNTTIRNWLNFRFNSQQTNITLLLDKKILELEINDFIDNTYLEYKTDLSFGEKVLFNSQKKKILENTYQKVVSHIGHLHYIAKNPNISIYQLDIRLARC